MDYTKQALQLVEQLDVYCCVLTSEDKFGYVNKGFADFAGVSADKIMGESIIDIMHPKEAEKSIENNALILKEKREMRYDSWYTNGKGEKRYVSVTKTPCFNDEGEVTHILCRGHDMTEEVEDNEKLQKQYQDVVEAQVNMICRFLPDTTLTFANSSYSTQWGRKKDELIGTRFIDLVPLKERKTILSFLDSITKENPINTMVHEIELPDRSVIYVKWICRGFFDGKGNVKEFQGIGFDITEIEERAIILKDEVDHKERIIEEIREAMMNDSNKYRELVESLPDSIIIHKNGTVIFANKGAARLYQYQHPLELVGLDILTLVSSEHRDFARMALNKANKGEKVGPLELKVVKRDGTKVDIEVRGLPFIYKGEPCTINITRDISESKRNEELRRHLVIEERLREQAQEQEQMKTEFFANISHELRTPLNLMTTTLQLMDFKIKEGKNEVAERHVNILKQNCFRLSKLINNLIDITKIDSGYVEMKLRNIDLVKYTRDIVQSVKPMLMVKELKLDFDSQIPKAIVRCDPEKMERVLLNLLSNAVKFTPAKGHINISIEKMAHKICVSVKDNGIGIEDQYKDMIFERFKQIDKSFTRAHEGSGIGLALTKELVEMQGGKIYLKSVKDKGSEFIVELPTESVDSTSFNQFMDEPYTFGNVQIEFSDIYE